MGPRVRNNHVRNNHCGTKSKKTPPNKKRVSEEESITIAIDSTGETVVENLCHWKPLHLLRAVSWCGTRTPRFIFGNFWELGKHWQNSGTGQLRAFVKKSIDTHFGLCDGLCVRKSQLNWQSCFFCSFERRTSSLAILRGFSFFRKGQRIVWQDFWSRKGELTRYSWCPLRSATEAIHEEKNDVQNTPVIACNMLFPLMAWRHVDRQIL